MNTNKKKRDHRAIAEWLVVLLFFCGITAIVAGLWQMNTTIGLIALGCALLYVSACVSSYVNSPRKDDEK